MQPRGLLPSGALSRTRYIAKQSTKGTWQKTREHLCRHAVKVGCLVLHRKPSFSKVHSAWADGVADMEGALEDGTTAAAALLEPSKGPLTGMTLTLGS